MNEGQVVELYDDPFTLDVQIVVSEPVAGVGRACSTNDGCASTCASSCASRG